MSKRPTPTEIREHYKPDVEAMRTSDLLRMATDEGFEKRTPKYIKTELIGLANMECKNRGIEFPIFAKFFSP
jgi:hypothetical protein